MSVFFRHPHLMGLGQHSSTKPTFALQDTGFVLNNAVKTNCHPSQETWHGRDWVSHWGIRASDLGLLLWPVLEKARLGINLASEVPVLEVDPHQLAFLVRGS